MLQTRLRAVTIALGAALSIALIGMVGPVAAADDPEAAVNELLDIVGSQDLSGIEAVVCEADREGVLATFDVAAQMGLDASDAEPGILGIEITDRSVEIISQDGDTAIVKLAGTFSISVPEAEVETLVRQMLEADLGPDDPPISDEDLATMLPFMSSALNQSQPMDQEITLVRENGEWLVCGGFGQPEEPETGFEAQISNEGLCGLASPAEVTSVGSLEYDNSSGFETVCTYSNSPFESYHSTTLSLNQGYDLADLKGIYPPDAELDVAGNPAFVAGTQLFAQVGNDVLQVNLYPGEDPPADFDIAAEATAVTELFIPRLPALAGPEAEPTPEPTPEISLCEALSRDELIQITGMAFDDVSGDSASCAYTSFDPEGGFRVVNVYTSQGSLDDFREYFPDVTDLTVGGRPAITTAGQLFIELTDGVNLLNVSVLIDPSAEETEMTAAELAVLVAEQIIANLG